MAEYTIPQRNDMGQSFDEKIGVDIVDDIIEKHDEIAMEEGLEIKKVLFSKSMHDTFHDYLINWYQPFNDIKETTIRGMEIELKEEIDEGYEIATPPICTECENKSLCKDTGEYYCPLCQEESRKGFIGRVVSYLHGSQ